jgi:hypothetical protein
MHTSEKMGKLACRSDDGVPQHFRRLTVFCPVRTSFPVAGESKTVFIWYDLFHVEDRWLGQHKNS